MTYPDRSGSDSADRRPPLPQLTSPVLVAAFEGWNDAGDAASTAIEHLQLSWDATPLAELDPEDYYDFQVTRPTTKLVDGITRRIDWPTTRLSVCRPPGADYDVVLVHGIEPNMRWRSFCNELLGYVMDLGITSVVTLGALLADTPHTRPVPVTGTSYDAASAARFQLERSKYEGPTGIVGVFQDACVQAGVPAISLTVASHSSDSSGSPPSGTSRSRTSSTRCSRARVALGEGRAET